MKALAHCAEDPWLERHFKPRTGCSLIFHPAVNVDLVRDNGGGERNCPPYLTKPMAQEKSFLSNTHSPISQHTDCIWDLHLPLIFILFAFIFICILTYKPHSYDVACTLWLPTPVLSLLCFSEH